MIRIEALDKSYHAGGRALHVLKGIDLHVPAGELVAIMGSSGSGKTTLLNILGLLDRYDAGTYRLDGRLVRDLSEREAAALRNRKLGFVFQAFHLLPGKTAVENVALPLYYRSIPRRRRNALALQALDRLDLADWGDHYPNELSGGQQQRVAIARALITEPSVLLADEPTGALDSETSQELLGLLQQVNRDGVTMVVVTHERDIAQGAQRIVHLKDGRVEREEHPR